MMNKRTMVLVGGALLMSLNGALAGGLTPEEQSITLGAQKQYFYVESPAIRYYRDESTEAERRAHHMKQRYVTSKKAYKAQKKRWRSADRGERHAVRHERYKRRANYWENQYADLVNSYVPQTVYRYEMGVN